jgi:hypothetical protein
MSSTVHVCTDTSLSTAQWGAVWSQAAAAANIKTSAIDDERTSPRRAGNASRHAQVGTIGALDLATSAPLSPETITAAVRLTPEYQEATDEFFADVFANAHNQAAANDESICDGKSTAAAQAARQPPPSQRSALATITEAQPMRLIASAAAPTGAFQLKTTFLRWTEAVISSRLSTSSLGTPMARRSEISGRPVRACVGRDVSIFTPGLPDSMLKMQMSANSVSRSYILNSLDLATTSMSTEGTPSGLDSFISAASHRSNQDESFQPGSPDSHNSTGPMALASRCMHASAILIQIHACGHA